MAEIIPPFSNRNLGAHLQIESDFPESARTALSYLLHDLVARDYADWIALAREAERITRIQPTIYYDSGSDRAKARLSTEKLLVEMPWEKVLDFCERLYGTLRKNRTGASAYIASEIERIFVEENLAFEFRDGLVERRGRRHTSIQVSRAQVVLGDSRLDSARKHFNKALRYFQSVSKPDPENAVKEAVCAVEATARVLFPDVGGKTLGEITKSLTGPQSGKLPKAVANTFQGLYGFRSGGEGVAHGGATGGTVTQAIAEYVVAVAASQIILLVDLANSEETEVPF